MPDTFGDLHPDQQQLFDDLRDPHTLARTTDPDTSHAAARMRRGSQRWRMLTAFHKLHPVPATWDQAARVAGIRTQSAPWVRCSELADAGFIQVEGIGRTTLNAKAQAYTITDEGVAFLHSK